MISDNGRYFRLSPSLLHQIMENTRVKRELEERGSRWKFIPPKAPWQGGFYERLIGVIKGCLKKTLFKKRVGIEDLYTIVAEVESRVNNRPLTYVSDDIDELEALTPSHLNCGRRLKSVPSVTHTLDQWFLNFFASRPPSALSFCLAPPPSTLCMDPMPSS